MKNRALPWILFAIALAALAAVGILYLMGRESCGTYQYINTDIACGDAPVVSKTNYLTLQNDIADYIGREKAGGKINEVAVYFRDLRDGPSFGINSSDAFAPASLLKLPLVMALFELSEDHPEVLDTKLLYSNAALSQKYQIPKQINFDFAGEGLLDGGTYTVRDLMRASIVYSDNTAYYALVDFINNNYAGGTDYVLKAFQQLGVVDPRTPDEETVTVNGYASLFRLLYNASFLNTDDSEQLLSWLAAASFNAGLEAGVPKGVVVANKFGEREDDSTSSGLQLHDCGIIYYPGNPYTLCVMSNGSNWDELKSIISTISKMVYNEVDNRAKQQ